MRSELGGEREEGTATACHDSLPEQLRLCIARKYTGVVLALSIHVCIVAMQCNYRQALACPSVAPLFGGSS